MRKSLLIFILTILILASVPGMAEGGATDVNPLGSINFTERVVYFLNHTSDPDEGNWISIGSSDEGRRIQLPQPIKLTYSGPKYKEYGGTSGTLYKEEDENFTITYPSTSRYFSHPVYLPGENVNISFYGESRLEGEVEIYLFKVSSDFAYGLFDALKAGDIESLNNLFHSNVKEEDYEKYSAVLGNNGDLLDYALGPLETGEYCIVMMQENEDGSLTALSSTAFVVTECELFVDTPSSIVQGEDLDISIELEDASEGNYTYGAILIRDQAYKANIEINSDGTENGTDVIINEVNIINEFGISSSNYRSKLTRNELQTEIQTLIGQDNGAIAIGETGQKTLSLTTFELPVGSYYLFAGAYNPEKGLSGLTQLEVEIESKSDSNDDDDDSGNGRSGGKKGGSGGGGGSPEPAKNVKSKELCREFVSNGNRIKFEFTEGVTCVGYVEFTAKKTAGKITTTVEELKGKSSLTPEEAEGEIYKHINIWVGNNGFATSTNIENAIVGFKVSKEWIDENHINADSLTLQHFSDKRWYSLPTRKVGEDRGYIYFEAETPGFSPFAISAEKNSIVSEEAGGENQGSSEIMPQGETETTTESDTASQENKNQGILKITSFLVGFLTLILIEIIRRKREPVQEEPGLERSEQEEPGLESEQEEPEQKEYGQ